VVCAETQPLPWRKRLAQSVRVVQGTVLNSDGQHSRMQGLPEDQTTLQWEHVITEADGPYRFETAGVRVDYQTWAELQGSKVQNRAISPLTARSNSNFVKGRDPEVANALENYIHEPYSVQAFSDQVTEVVVELEPAAVRPRRRHRLSFSPIPRGKPKAYLSSTSWASSYMILKS